MFCNLNTMNMKFYKDKEEGQKTKNKIKARKNPCLVAHPYPHLRVENWLFSDLQKPETRWVISTKWVELKLLVQKIHMVGHGKE